MSGSITRSRCTYGEYHHLFQNLKQQPKEFFEYLRMSVSTFNYILERVAPYLQKDWCNFHKQRILPEERLVLTLRFLATGRTYSDLRFSFKMALGTVSLIIKDTLGVLWKVLQPVFMPVPTKEYLHRISQDFDQIWQFPHCVGVIDGRHIEINKPPHSGSRYYNYKKYFSICLQALVDAKYRFVTIDVGGYGSTHDATIFRASSLYTCLVTKKLILPREDRLPNSNILVPYVIIGDGAYPLLKNLMKPFPGHNLSERQRNFNKRLSRARVVVENTFGQLTRKWQILDKKMDKPLDISRLVVQCACLLHNVIIDLESNQSQRYDQHVHGSYFDVECGKEIREKFTDYFMNEI